MNFIPSEQNQRHAFVDESMASIHDFVLGNPAVQNVLGPDVVAGIDDVVANYYVPNKRDNTYAPTKSQIASDLHPIVAVLPDERFRFSPSFAEFSEGQVASIYSYLEDEMSATEIAGFIDDCRAGMRASIYGARAVIDLNEMDVMLAVYALDSMLADEETDQEIAMVRGRPIQLLDRSKPIETHVHLHEFIHHWQIYTRPIVELPDAPHAGQRLHLEEEHEAYKAESGVIDAMCDSDLPLSVNEQLAHDAVGIIDTVLAATPSDEVNPLDEFERLTLLRLRELRKARRTATQAK